MMWNTPKLPEITTRFLSLLLVIIPHLMQAQWQDDFSDGEFSSNPIWTGNTENFEVNSDGALQLNDVDVLLTQSALASALNLTDINGIQWQFDVAQNFSGSDNNHSRIYLTSTQANPVFSANNTANTQGYYLKLGEAGSADVIKLYIDNGSTTTLLASGTTLISSAFDISIRVTRDAAGNWNVEMDPAGGSNYNFECSATDNSFTTANYFAVICNYTSSNADGFTFDNFYVGPPIIDTTAPAIQLVEVPNETTLSITMSEAIDPNSLLPLTQYVVSNTISPIAASLDENSSTILILTFADPFAANQQLTLAMQGVTDLSGNALPLTESSFVWSVLLPLAYRDIVFNEVLADPSPIVGLPEVEYIELHNRTENAIDLGGLVFTNTNTDKILTTYLLEAGEYVVLCNSTEVANFSNALGIPSFTALTNGGDSLTLKDSFGNIIDQLEYSIDWYATSSKANGGWSLEQVNPNYPCGNNAGNWLESIAATGGTPGTINSVYDIIPDANAPAIVSVTATGPSSLAIAFSEVIDTANWNMTNVPMMPFNQILSTHWDEQGLVLTAVTQSILDEQTEYSFGLNPIADCYGNNLVDGNIIFLLGSEAAAGQIRISEIYADPDEASPLPNAEWIELHNTTATYLRLDGLLFNGQVISGAPLAPDEYLILADNGSEAAFTELATRVAFLSSFSLTNSGMNLQLEKADGTLIDQVTYTIDWYQDATKANGGWSLELINETLPCSGESNWSASISNNQGTPGISNSLQSTAPDTTAPIITSVAPIDAFHFLIVFSETMETTSLINSSFDIIPFNTVLQADWNGSANGLLCETQFELNNSTYYSFNLGELTDCSGNGLSSAPYEFVLGVAPQFGDLIITEIMPDPSPSQGLPNAEYIEIYNPTNLQINLYGIYVNGGRITTSYILGPNQYVMVTEDVNELAFLFQNISKLFTDGWLDLSNSGDEVELLNNQESLLHRLEYDISWYQDSDKEDGGWSLEIESLTDPCSYSDNWHASTSPTGGTPGAVNSVNDPHPDLIAPLLEYVYVQSDSEIIFDFNEPMDANSVATATIVLSGGEPLVANITLDNLDPTRVHVNTTQMVNQTVYQYVLSGLTDCWGNEAGQLSGHFGAPDVPSVGDLVINEILFDPYEGASKFVEVYNRSEKNISLANWKLNDLTSGEVGSMNEITTLGIMLYPGEYLVLTESKSGVSEYYHQSSSNRLFAIADLPDYTSDDMVILLMPDSSICDAVAYNSDYHYPLLDDTKGVSLERIQADRDSDDATNWHSAASTVGYATPGYRNSQSMPTATTESSFGVNPSTFSPDNDGFNDQVQFNYTLDSEGFTGNLRIYDSEGRLVRKLMQNELLGREGTISWDGINDDRQKAGLGIYVIYFEVFNTQGKKEIHKETCVLAHLLN